MKEEIREIHRQLIKQVETKEDCTYEKFLIAVKPLFLKYNCFFGYQSRNSKLKNGHFKKIIDFKTQRVKYEIRIERDDDDISKLYTLAHELSHLINHHLEAGELTKKQQEIVADTSAKMICKYCGVYGGLETATINRRIEVLYYSERYSETMQVSEQKIKIMTNQIMYAYETLVNYLENSIQKEQ